MYRILIFLNSTSDLTIVVNKLLILTIVISPNIGEVFGNFKIWKKIFYRKSFCKIFFNFLLFMVELIFSKDCYNSYTRLFLNKLIGCNILHAIFILFYLFIFDFLFTWMHLEINMWLKFTIITFPIIKTKNK